MSAGLVGSALHRLCQRPSGCASVPPLLVTVRTCRSRTVPWAGLSKAVLGKGLWVLHADQSCY